MTTWGPSKRRTKRSAAAPRSRRTASSTPSRGQQAKTEVREGVEGREHEFVGIGLIVGGLLLALATFFNLAGPLGRGARTALAWLFGFGLIAVPIVLIAVGVSLVRKGRSASPMRLIIGWSLVALATLGLLHVFGGPQSFTDLDELDDAGGLLGALVGEPLEALLATGGAAVLLIGIVIGGALLITQTSLRTMASRTGSTVSTVARPLGRAARQALRDLSSLSSDERDERDERTRETPPTRRLPCRNRCRHQCSTTPPATSTMASTSRGDAATDHGARHPRLCQALSTATDAGRCRPRPFCIGRAPTRSTEPRSRLAVRSSSNRSSNTVSTRRSWA